MSAPESAGGVAVVIVNYRTPDLAIRCVRSLDGERAAVPGLDVIVVDGGSADGSAERIGEALAASEFTGWTSALPLPINGGFGWANNQAMLRLFQRREPPDFIHILNPDTEVEAGAVKRLVDYLQAHPQCGAVGSKLLRPDGTAVGSAFRFPSIGRELVRGAATPALGRLLGVRPMLAEGQGDQPDWVTGASVMLRAAALRESGLFDDGFFLYFEEVELMSRMRRAGWQIGHEPGSHIRHIGGAATGVKAASASRPPAYWFNSRRRMFVRMRGRFTATLATLAWLAGRGIWTIRRWTGLTKGKAGGAPEFADHLKISLRGRAEDDHPAFPRWDDAPGAEPAWMKTTP